MQTMPTIMNMTTTASFKHELRNLESSGAGQQSCEGGLATRDALLFSEAERSKD